MTTDGVDVVANAKKLAADDRERIFTHGLHEEGIFYNRLNFFLVFESLLFAGIISGYSGKDAPPAAIATPICILGMLVSVLWWYAQVNKLILLRTLEKRAEELFDEFRETVRLANEQRVLRVWSANVVLAHALPSIFLTAWVYFFWYTLTTRG